MTRPPLIVDVKRHSLEDGPGIRSVVFFKGCPLACSFCHNPETQDPTAEIAFHPEYCIRCGLCETVCEYNAIHLDHQDRIDRERCTRCKACVEICPSRALQVIGKAYTVPELMEVVLKDRVFYKHSKGGVTLSGGECTLHPDYLEVLLQALKKESVHVTIESCGHFDYTSISRKVLPFVDLLYFDLKFADPDIHKQFTQKDNRIILNNLERVVVDKSVPVIIRIPLIPEVTATHSNLCDIADLLKTLGVTQAPLLPYNPLGLDKWKRIGKSKPKLSEKLMSKDEITKLIRRFESILTG